MNSSINSRGVRRGASAVEFAVVLPIVVLLIFGAIEIGRAVMVQHSLQEAAQAGCRLYTVKNLTQQQVTDMIDTSMANAGITAYTIEMDPPTKAAVDAHMEPVTVKVSVGYDAVSWMPVWFMSGKTIVAQATMPADLEEVYDGPTGGDVGGDPADDDKDDKGKGKGKGKKDKK